MAKGMAENGGDGEEEERDERDGNERMNERAAAFWYFVMTSPHTIHLDIIPEIDSDP